MSAQRRCPRHHERKTADFADSEKRPLPAPGYQVEVLDGDILLFHPASLTITHSNASGALIWQLCDGRRTAGDIVVLLQAAYPEAAAAIERDVPEILQTWFQNGMIQWQ